jgi:phosphomannomutase
MGLLLIELVASSGKSLYDLVENMLRSVGPAYYQRNDLRLHHPVSKERMKQILLDGAPAQIAGVKVENIATIDGVKYILSDDSWLLIRPSGTEPVLRVYAEGRSPEMVQGMIGFGEQVAVSAA